MGMLEGLKRTLNIAGSKIVVLTEEQTYSQSDLIRGDILVTAPEYRQAGNSIKVELKELWTETRSTGKSTRTETVHKTRAEVVLQGTFDFEPRSQHQFSFELRLPRNCRISTSDTGWCLAVGMEIPKALDPTARVVLDVQPAEDFLAIIETCEEHLGFQERQKSRRWNSRFSRTYFRLMPPEELKSELDYLALDVSQIEDGGVEGDLVFNLQEKSITDYLKAAVGKDKIERHFHFTPCQLCSQDGRLNSGDLAEFIRGSLQEVIDQRVPKTGNAKRA